MEMLSQLYFTGIRSTSIKPVSDLEQRMPGSIMPGEPGSIVMGGGCGLNERIRASRMPCFFLCVRDEWYFKFLRMEELL